MRFIIDEWVAMFRIVNHSDRKLTYKNKCIHTQSAHVHWTTFVELWLLVLLVSYFFCTVFGGRSHEWNEWSTGRWCGCICANWIRIILTAIVFCKHCFVLFMIRVFEEEKNTCLSIYHRRWPQTWFIFQRFNDWFQLNSILIETLEIFIFCFFRENIHWIKW